MNEKILNEQQTTFFELIKILSEKYPKIIAAKKPSKPDDRYINLYFNDGKGKSYGKLILKYESSDLTQFGFIHTDLVTKNEKENSLEGMLRNRLGVEPETIYTKYRYYAKWDRKYVIACSSKEDCESKLIPIIERAYNLYN